MTEPSNVPTPQTPDFMPPSQPWNGGAVPGQTPGNPYAAPGSPYPAAGSPYPAPGSPYPAAGSPYAPGSPYPNPGSPYPAPGSPYPGNASYPAGSPQPAGAPYPAAPPSAAGGTFYTTAAENVGRGIAFSLLGIVLGAFLAALLYQWGFIASITSFLMAVAAGWLYRKGAGAAPVKGVVPLIGVIVAGVIASLFAMLAWGLYAGISADNPGVPAGEIWAVVGDNLFYPPVWEAFATDALIFVAFAALGTFSMLRQLRRGATPGAPTR